MKPVELATQNVRLLKILLGVLAFLVIVTIGSVILLN